MVGRFAQGILGPGFREVGSQAIPNFLVPGCVACHLAFGKEIGPLVRIVLVILKLLSTVAIANVTPALVSNRRVAITEVNQARVRPGSVWVGQKWS